MSRSITIDATIDLGDIGDDDLIAEMQSRELVGAEISDDLALVHRAVSDDRKADALALVERLMRPKYKTLNECMTAQRAQHDYLFRGLGK